MVPFLHIPERGWLLAGLACYGAALLLTLRRGAGRGEREGWALGLVAAAVALIAAAIADRWLRLGYGPFVTLYEVILSNLFSLGLVYGLAHWRLPAVRSGGAVALGVILVLGVWALTVPTDASRLPATFESPWLWVHVGFGKLFLGLTLVGVGLAGVLLLGGRSPATSDTAGPERLDGVLWRLMAGAFVLQSLMLVSGAIWAQDAWGHYWRWDPLETWAFVTWLVLAVALHARVTYRLPFWVGWAAVLGVFALAVLTFLGVPFLSDAPHKGVV